MSVYESIIQGLNEAVEFEKGTGRARVNRVTAANIVPIPEISSQEVKDIRVSLNMTQVVFAGIMGVSAKTVEAWESGINTPSGTARRMLSMLKADPDVPKKYNFVD